MTHTAKVRTHKLSSQASLCISGYRLIGADSPAIEAMTDFSQTQVVTIGADATLLQANALMIARAVRLLIVVGANEQLEGLITARDILGEKPLQLAEARLGKREELSVRELMCPLANIDTLYLSEVMNVRVIDVLEALKSQGRQHILVEDRDPLTGLPRVRGIFSATQIGRQLGVPVVCFELAQTFAEIEAALVH